MKLFLQHFTASCIMGYQEKGLQITLAREKQVSIFLMTWRLSDRKQTNKQKLNKYREVQLTQNKPPTVCNPLVLSNVQNRWHTELCYTMLRGTGTIEHPNRKYCTSVMLHRDDKNS